MAFHVYIRRVKRAWRWAAAADAAYREPGISQETAVGLFFLQLF